MAETDCTATQQKTKPAQSKQDESQGISFSQYRDRILKLEEDVTKQLQDRVQQNANFMSLIITFVFLFEMDFVAGAFPSELASIDYPRYSPCLSILVAANAALVLALALLLKVTTCLKSSAPDMDAHFLSRQKDMRSHPDQLVEEERALRYGITVSLRENLEAAERVVFYARRFTLMGMVLGVLSAIMLLVNGRVLNSLHEGLQGDDTIMPGMYIWTALAVLWLVAGVILYILLSRDISRTRRKNKADKAQKLGARVAECFKACYLGACKALKKALEVMCKALEKRIKDASKDENAAAMEWSDKSWQDRRAAELHQEYLSKVAELQDKGTTPA